MGESQTAAEQTVTRTYVPDRRVRLASPATAVVLGALTFGLAVLYVPLAYPAHDVADGWQVLAAFLALSVPGVAVARRQPTNPVGWILIGVGVEVAFYTDVERYAVFDYHFHHGHLLFGPAAALVATSLWFGLFLGLPLVILLFPDGRLSRRWRAVLWAYLAIAGGLVALVFGVTAWEMIGNPISVSNNGQQVENFPAGVSAVLTVVIVALLALWFAFVGRQVVSWRRADGERRQQLKWLMSAGALSVVGFVAMFHVQSSGPRFLALFALPVGVSIGILKYRLYDIDRIISRTLSYAIVTGVVVGVYVGIVTLTTKALGFRTPVAVAASTLAAVALFNPLRHRVQRFVDRRFNRARYDAEATIAMFTARLRDAVDLETVRSELLEVVNRAIEPAHASVWIKRDKSD